MKPERIIALIFGSLLAIPALAVFVSGGVLAIALAAQRDDGYFDATLDRLESSAVAITAEDIDLRVEPGTPRWVLDALDADVRLRVTPVNSSQPIFIGIARESDLDGYLAGVAHDEIDSVDELTATYRSRSGASSVTPPADETFWETSVTGTGTQELEWETQTGRWAVALMNADGSPNVAADVNVGIRSPVLVPLAIGLLAIGAVLAAIAFGLIMFGGAGLHGRPASEVSAHPAPPAPTAASAEPGLRQPYPLAMSARLDPELSNWQWLLKWFLAIPHMIILFFLWTAFFLLTVVAGFAILFTGRYPRGIFDFNVGVLRWSWRVSYYAFTGGLGTDRYPPFSFAPHPEYPATLSVDYPEQLSRGLVLVKWWLLAIPHYLIVALIAGAGFQWGFDNDVNTQWGPQGAGLLGILTLVAAVILLFRGSYPRQLFDLIIGMNRWVYRVTAYAALMTDVYPPFRLDQGGSELSAPPDAPQPGDPEGRAVDLRSEPDEADSPTPASDPIPASTSTPTPTPTPTPNS